MTCYGWLCWGEWEVGIGSFLIDVCIDWPAICQTFIYLHLLILLVNFYSPFGHLYYVQYFHGVFKMSSHCSVFLKTSQMCFWVSWCSSCCADVCAMMCLQYVLSLWSRQMCNDVHTVCSFTMKHMDMQWCAYIMFFHYEADRCAVMCMHLQTYCFQYEAYRWQCSDNYACIMLLSLWSLRMCVHLQTCCFHC